MMTVILLLSFLLAASADYTQLIPQKGYKIEKVVTTGVNGTRQLIFDRSNGDLLTIARGIQRVVCIWETSPNQFQTAVILDGSNANPSFNFSHGINQRGKYIYVSSVCFLNT
jgi:hypothetical protein